MKLCGLYLLSAALMTLFLLCRDCSAVSLTVWVSRHDTDVAHVDDQVPVRLAGSQPNPRQGRLEIYYKGAWGTVCDDGITDIAAKVACQQLGFGYLGYILRTVHDAGAGPIWLSKVQCTGAETELGQCSHAPWGYNDCEHQQDVSIACYVSQQTVDERWFVVAAFAVITFIIIIVAIAHTYFRHTHGQYNKKRKKEKAQTLALQIAAKRLQISDMVDT